MIIIDTESKNTNHVHDITVTNKIDEATLENQIHDATGTKESRDGDPAVTGDTTRSMQSDSVGSDSNNPLSVYYVDQKKHIRLVMNEITPSGEILDSVVNEELGSLQDILNTLKTTLISAPSSTGLSAYLYSSANNKRIR